MICNAIEDLETNVRDVKQFLDAATIAFEFSRTDHGDVNDVVDDVVEWKKIEKKKHVKKKQEKKNMI